MTHLSRVCLSPYLYFVVTMSVSRTVSTILRVKEWQDLEIWVLGRSRSFEMAQFDGLCTPFYWSAIVTIAPSFTSFTIFELFHVE